MKRFTCVRHAWGERHQLEDIEFVVYACGGVEAKRLLDAELDVLAGKFRPKQAHGKPWSASKAKRVTA